jgi:hypothetical protein
VHGTLVHDVTVITPDLPIGEASARELIELLRAHVDDELIVDLRGVEPLAASLGALLLAGRDRPDGCCVVSRGPGPAGIVRFASVGDALQARALARCGYGRGWAVA